MELAEHLRVMEATFYAIDHGVLMSDPDGTDLLCNPAFGEIVGIPFDRITRLPQEEMRRIALEKVADPEAFNAYMERVYADPELVLTDEFKMISPTPRTLRRHTAPVTDRSGRVLGRLWTFTDVTETRMLQAESLLHEKHLEDRLAAQARELHLAHVELLQAARIQAAGAMAVGVAQDIRNILTGLRLELDTMPAAEFKTAAAAQLDRLYTLTHSLLALSEEPPTARTMLNIEEIIDFAISLVGAQAETDGVKLVKQVSGAIPAIRGNARRLEQLFILLITNGVHAMAPTGGILTISISSDTDTVHLDVSDNGPGVPAEDLPYLYDPFFTTRANRAGMGLFSARRIVEEHTGQINIISSPGCGACVSVLLPVLNTVEELQ